MIQLHAVLKPGLRIRVEGVDETGSFCTNLGRVRIDRVTGEPIRTVKELVPELEVFLFSGSGPVLPGSYRVQ